MKEKLRTDSVRPLYAQIVDRIGADILRGVYAPGSRIPAEAELEGRYGVSRVPVRRALQELTASGLLERKQGKGTFVSMPKEERADRPVRGFHEACRDAGKRPSAVLISAAEGDADADTRLRLNLPEEARVLTVRRVLYADGAPVALQRCCFSMAYAWLEQAELSGSIYDLLQEYGVRAEKSTYDLSLVRAGEEESRRLGVPEGSALLRAEQTVYDQRGRPLHTAVSLILADRFTLRL